VQSGIEVPKTRTVRQKPAQRQLLTSDAKKNIHLNGTPVDLHHLPAVPGGTTRSRSLICSRCFLSRNTGLEMDP